MLCPNELAAAITAVAISLSDGRTPVEISAIGAVFTQLGDTLATIAAQQSLRQELCEKQNNENKQR